jgi:rhamnosyltransferase
MTPPPKQVCAVLVAFHPSQQLLVNVSLLLDQVSHLVIVDNGSTGASLNLLRTLEADPRVSLILNPSNEGIATALNQGLKLGLKMGYSWVITFDQDSTVTPGMVIALLECIQSGSENTAIAAPSYIDRGLGTRLGEVREEDGTVRKVLTSGMLVPSWLFDRIGFMNEDLFIDCVDLEFCQRARAMGYRIVQCEAAQLLHSLGRLTKFRLFGREFEATNHNAARKYYQVRNRLWMLGHPRLGVRWRRDAWQEITSIGWDTVKVVLVEDHKLEKLFRIAQGAWDAAAGRMGKRVEL